MSIALPGLVILGATLILSLGRHPETGGPETKASAWGNAPDLALSTLDGRNLKLSDFKGNVIILNLWVMACPYCRLQMADLNRLHAEYKDRGLVVIGVNLDSRSMKKVRAFCENENLGYPTAISNPYEVSRGYFLRGFPTTFIIDQKGNIAGKVVGYRNYEAFAPAVEKLLTGR